MKIHMTSCDDLPYGPGQSDYEYDRARQREVDAEQDAIQSIIEDFLLLGRSYPKKGGKGCITAGIIVQTVAEPDEIEAMLTALVYEPLWQWQDYAERLVRDNAPRILREMHSNLVQQRVEEMERDEA